MTGLDTPVNVLQLTGALMNADGTAVRIGAEGCVGAADGDGRRRLRGAARSSPTTISRSCARRGARPAGGSRWSGRSRCGTSSLSWPGARNWRCADWDGRIRDDTSPTPCHPPALDHRRRVAGRSGDAPCAAASSDGARRRAHPHGARERVGAGSRAARCGAVIRRLVAPRWVYSDESGMMNREQGITAFTAGPDTVTPPATTRCTSSRTGAPRS